MTIIINGKECKMDDTLYKVSTTMVKNMLDNIKNTTFEQHQPQLYYGMLCAMKAYVEVVFKEMPEETVRYLLEKWRVDESNESVDINKDILAKIDNFAEKNNVSREQVINNALHSFITNFSSYNK